VSKESQLKAFGAHVKHLRKQQGLTQEALAERSGLSTRYVSRVELGNVNLGLRAILQIAGGLNVPPARLLEGVPA
jgi:transcriptional regulator with XRE-family HTH domain